MHDERFTGWPWLHGWHAAMGRVPGYGYASLSLWASATGRPARRVLTMLYQYATAVTRLGISDGFIGLYGGVPQNLSFRDMLARMAKHLRALKKIR